MPDERTHTGHGKWSRTGVPHRGWSCVFVDDLGEPSQTCEMCESVDIRYAHHMQHPDYPEVLAVGCICAERMENDYVRPREREERLKRAARRRVTWPRRAWKISRRDNFYLNTEGYNLTIVPDGARYRVKVLNRTTGASQLGQRFYDNTEAAKLGALTALLWAKDRL